VTFPTLDSEILVEKQASGWRVVDSGLFFEKVSFYAPSGFVYTVNGTQAQEVPYKDYESEYTIGPILAGIYDVEVVDEDFEVQNGKLQVNYRNDYAAIEFEEFFIKPSTITLLEVRAVADVTTIFESLFFGKPYDNVAHLLDGVDGGQATLTGASPAEWVYNNKRDSITYMQNNSFSYTLNDVHVRQNDEVYNETFYSIGQGGFWSLDALAAGIPVSIEWQQNVEDGSGAKHEANSRIDVIYRRLRGEWVLDMVDIERLYL
jgi:hypothetical protein